MQRIYEARNLPNSGLSASVAFYGEHLAAVEKLMAQTDTACIVVVLDTASPDHDDWRKAIARDLARAFAPKRINIASGAAGNELDVLLKYLGNARGVTGQYCQAYD